VAVVELAAPLRIGEMVEISGHGRTFSQKVDSLQADHKPIESASPGQSIGMKVAQPVHEGDRVFKLQPQAIA
jgi:translation elongation factor EF-1alpha